MKRACGTRARRSMSACCTTPPARTTRSMSGWCRYDVAPRSRMRDMLHAQQLLSAADLAAIRDGADARSARSTRAGSWRVKLDRGGRPDGAREPADRAHRRGRRTAASRAARATIKCSRRCACTCATRRTRCSAGALAVAEALEALAAREAPSLLPGYTHMQQAMPSTVALWALGFAARDSRRCRGSRGAVQRRIDKNPLGSAAGYGTPRSADSTASDTRRARLRRHARAGDRRAALARQGRSAAVVRDHAAHAGHGSSRRRPAARSTRRNSASCACRERSPPAPRSCRRSAIPTCSS